MARTVVITGGSDGLGAAAAKKAAAAGDRVVLVGRSPEKTARAAQEAGIPTNDTLTADFTRLDDVRALASEIEDRVDRIDVLANNAGGVFGTRALTADGYEKTLQVNHLAPFLLTTLLLERLREGDGTVVATSSVGARYFGNIDLADLDNARNYSPEKAYGDAKLANILFAKELQKRHGADGINAVALHPGNVRTNFAAETTNRVMKFAYRTPIGRLTLISVDKGADNLLWAINGTPGITWQPGGYYETQHEPKKVNPQQNDAGLAASLWDRSAELTSITA